MINVNRKISKNFTLNIIGPFWTENPAYGFTLIDFQVDWVTSKRRIYEDEDGTLKIEKPHDPWFTFRFEFLNIHFLSIGIRGTKYEEDVVV